MGSPSSRLNTQEKLRPWVESGLEFVLNSGAVQPVEAPVAQVQQQQAPALAAPVQAPVEQQYQTAQKPPQRKHFPEPWSTFLARVPSQPKVLWTYMELGLDLGGQADPKRGAVLRNLLTNHLKWPKGTTAFWPVAALSDGALQPDSRMFWQGWELWKTPYIACFGEEALQIIHPQAEPGNTTYLLEHVTIFVLPPLSRLVTLLPHEQQLSIELLSAVRL